MTYTRADYEVPDDPEGRAELADRMFPLPLFRLLSVYPEMTAPQIVISDDRPCVHDVCPVHRTVTLTAHDPNSAPEQECVMVVLAGINPTTATGEEHVSTWLTLEEATRVRDALTRTIDTYALARFVRSFATATADDAEGGSDDA